MPLVGQLLLALGIDAKLVINAALVLLVTCVVVVLIIVQSVAMLLSGSRADANPTNGSSPPAGTPVTLPAPTTGVPFNADLDPRIVQLAQTWVGVPYLFGGCSRGGVDCSCLVQHVYAAVGVHLPRVAVDQFNATIAVRDPQPGDLVFFANTYEPGISHVGIYIGNGLQINAPTTGEVVSIAPVFTGYWGSHFAGARRVRT
jgi:cell wall-associated NlpC family hydrolase